MKRKEAANEIVRKIAKTAKIEKVVENSENSG